MRRDRIISTPRKVTTRRRLRPSSLDLPLLPVRDIVIFPSMVLPLFVGREASIRAVERAMSVGRQLVFVAQRQAAVEEPGADRSIPRGHGGVGSAHAKTSRWTAEIARAGTE